jgi:hypothetical protein
MLIWSSYYETFFKLVDDYHVVSYVKPGRGDKWMFNGSSEPLSARFPRLFSYVLYLKISASQFYQTDDKSTLFYLPLSEQAHEEFNQL